MNVSHQNTDNLNAVISIEISKADYQEKVDKSLRAYGQKANIPGFRKGKVPFSMLMKMFGKSVRVEEINRLVSESLYNYIRDNKLNILGEPMTAEDMTVDLDTQDDFTFRFDVALAPELNVKVDKKIKVPYYTITVDDDMVKRQNESFLSRFGKQISVDESTDERDLIKGSMVEMVKKGTPVEGGITVESTIVSPAYFKNDKEKAKFAGVKKGDKVMFNPSKSCDASVAELASMLNIDKEKAANVTSNFEMTVTDITHLQLIKEQIVKQFDIHVDDADLLALAKRVAASQFAQYGMTGVPDDVLERYAREMLSSKESRSRLIDQATEQKIQTAIKESVTLTDKEVTMDKFQKMFEVAE